MGNYNRNAINYAKQYLKKGSQVYVEGKLETNKWQDQNGNDRNTTQVVLRPYIGKLIGLTRVDQEVKNEPDMPNEKIAFKDVDDIDGVVRQSLTRIKAPRSHKPMKHKFGTTP